ncbi:hypothetical protein Bcon01_67510 [Burkholderia contaminans]|nr:hypothetical protein Bcon01_67510 [Burkholderia contaminans]
MVDAGRTEADQDHDKRQRHEKKDAANDGADGPVHQTVHECADEVAHESHRSRLGRYTLAGLYKFDMPKLAQANEIGLAERMDIGDSSGTHHEDFFAAMQRVLRASNVPNGTNTRHVVIDNADDAGLAG